MYNMRRKSYNGPQSRAVGQRRDRLSNFVPGGQLHPQDAIQQAPRQNQGGRAPDSQNWQLPQRQQFQFNQQQHSSQAQQQHQTQQQHPPQTHQQASKIPQKVPEIQPQQPEPKIEQPPVVVQPQPVAQKGPQPQPTPKPEPVQQNNQSTMNTQPSNPQNEPQQLTKSEEMDVSLVKDDVDTEEDSPKKKNPAWKMKPRGKISKVDKIRRRNQRLRKILQPKNASMVLNELIGGLAIDIQEVGPQNVNPDRAFRATVVFDNVEHEGFGKSKALAKSAASEAVIKYLFMKKVKKVVIPNNSNPLQPEAAEPEADVKMEDEDEDDLFSWSHVASFAIYKLLSTWDDGSVINSINSPSGEKASSVCGSVTGKPEKLEPKPAKKMPDSAETMNPLMLLHQMFPNTAFQELSKIGNPPNVQFSIRCIVGDKEFIGHGPNKKAARKLAAYLACQNVLNIQYPPEIINLIETAIATKIG